ncbi:3-hydroxybutyrate dehydrogenase [Terasakiella sp. A23]|uniref:3-hydroxybutyrate dehydrogenase n=1 Tax=Terasakiella sp. FCG-A23 TaxID=3080561 RepID=UPI00295409F1|nr:3-hydroxybutyrate dehydrogenase [Terasakiella sp. A23]MDV7340589.1 3-hydroxybutyrate dehydrogenase [Terasakiella sp. A23]
MFKGKTALVTGSTAGIGLGIAEVLAKAGCNVILNGRKKTDDVEGHVERFNKEYGGKTIFLGADLSDVSAIEKLMLEATKEFGGVDILVNNAGIQHVSPLEEFAPEKWDQVIALNLSSCFHTMRLALPYMKEQNWGRIINVASAHGLVGSANKAAYVAAKHGVLGMTKVCALETAETGITANSICPGWVRTELVENQIKQRADNSGRTIEEEAHDLLSEKQPSKQFVTTEQLGEAAKFLVSDAASQMTGTTMTMDGGWTSQ